MEREFSSLDTILNAGGSGETGATLDVSKYKYIVLEVSTASSANLTAKIQGSVSDARPDFTAAASASNHFTYIGFYDYDTGDFTAGDTGIVYSGTDSLRLLTVNVDFLKWLNIDVTAHSAGTITVKGIGVDNG